MLYAMLFLGLGLIATLTGGVSVILGGWLVKLIASMAVIASVAVTWGLSAWQLKKAVKTDVNPGEEAVWADITNSYAAVMRHLRMIGYGSVVAIIGVVAVVNAVDMGPGLLSAAWLLLGVVLAIGGPVMVYFSASQLKPVLGNLGWWWVTVPENHAAIIEHFGACYKIIINTSRADRRRHFELLIESRLRTGNNQYILLPQGKGIYFLGWNKWPWEYQLRKPWYYRSADVRNPAKSPMRYLSLAEFTVNLLHASASGGVVPVVGSNDLVQVEADLFLRLQVWDPYVAVYGAAHPEAAVEDLIISNWRSSLSKLDYFTSRGEKGEIHVNPDLQEQALQQFVYDLGLVAAPDNYDPKKIKKSQLPIVKPRLWKGRVENDGTETEDENGLLYFSSFPKPSVAHDSLVSYGFQVLTLNVDDLQPQNKEVIKAAEKRAVNAQEGMAAFEKAKGDRLALQEKAEGEAFALTKRAEAYTKPGGAEIFAGDVRREVADKVGNLTIIEGGGGNVSHLNLLGGAAVASQQPAKAKEEDEAKS